MCILGCGVKWVYSRDNINGKDKGVIKADNVIRV
jgi:hypothetical protein